MVVSEKGGPMAETISYTSDLPIVVPVTRCPACVSTNIGIRFCIDCGRMLHVS